MKSYIVDRSSSTPQLNEMPTNVEKIYQTKADAEAALANGDIADGEFVSTVDTVEDTGDKFDKSYLSYSTDETLTGGTWIDGKPIYRKSYYSSTNWANNTVIGTIANVSEVVNISSVSRTTSKDAYQNYSDGSSRNDAAFNIDTGELLVRRAAVFVNSYPAHVTIEYTKQ